MKTKEELARQKREKYALNPEKYIAAVKAHREKNIEKYREKDRLYYIKNRARLMEQARARYIKNHEANLANKKEYGQRPDVRQRINEYSKKYFKDRRASNIQFRLTCALRCRLWELLNRRKKAGSTVSDLGCSINDFKNYLETKFKDGMSWKNYGRHGWTLDHKIPLSLFDLTDRVQFLKACHYTNLQPLWAKDNLIKGDKVDESASMGAFSPALLVDGAVKNNN